MHHPTVTTGALLCVLGLPGAQGPDGSGGASLVGRWKVEYTLPAYPTAALEFEALASGRGWLTPLDAAGSNLSDPVRGAAVWARSATGVSFSGELNLPIGNVGFESLALSFEGTFASATTIKGTARLADPPPDAGRSAAPAGRFTATRIDEDRRR